MSLLSWRIKILLGSPLPATHCSQLRAAHSLFHSLLLTPALPGSKRLQMTLTISWSSQDGGGVVVRLRAGKEFPDTRQNEREIKFIRVGDAVRTANQLKGELTLNRGP